MQRSTPTILATPGEWLLLAVLAACYPLSALLPAHWGLENGVIENAQVLVLGAACVAALLVFQRTRPARIGMLALWSAPVWLLLVGRELSWGRALLPSSGLALGGSAAMHGIVWIQPYMRPTAVLLVLALVVCAWRLRLDEVVRAAFSRRTPWLCFAVALAAALGSTCAEGHMGCKLDLGPTRSYVFEELAELVAYVSLFMIQHAVLHQVRPRVALEVRSQAG